MEPRVSDELRHIFDKLPNSPGISFDTMIIDSNKEYTNQELQQTHRALSYERYFVDKRQVRGYDLDLYYVITPAKLNPIAELNVKIDIYIRNISYENPYFFDQGHNNIRSINIDKNINITPDHNYEQSDVEIIINEIEDHFNSLCKGHFMDKIKRDLMNTILITINEKIIKKLILNQLKIYKIILDSFYISIKNIAYINELLTSDVITNTGFEITSKYYLNDKDNMKSDSEIGILITIN